MNLSVDLERTQETAAADGSNQFITSSGVAVRTREEHTNEYNNY